MRNVARLFLAISPLLFSLAAIAQSPQSTSDSAEQSTTVQQAPAPQTPATQRGAATQPGPASTPGAVPSPQLTMPARQPTPALLAPNQPQQSPSPPLPPQEQMNLPALSPAPTQRTVPPGPNAAGVSITREDRPPVSALDPHEPQPNAPAPQLAHDEDTTAQPARDEARGLAPRFLGFLGPYRRPTVPPLFPGSETRLLTLIHDGRLYLSLDDAIALALENNLDVETERYNLADARTDLVRAQGGGNLRGIDYTIEEPPNGVGGPGSPLLSATTLNTNPTTPTVTDLTSLNALTQTQQSFSEMTTGFQFAPGANIPLFDPQLIGTAGWLRRSDTQTLTSVAGTTTTTGTGSGSGSGSTSSTTTTAPLDYTALNAAYLQGFSSGAQLEAVVNNDSQVIYGGQSELDPFYSPSTSITLTQPLLRGFGSNVNRRFIRIASTDRKISRLLFEQQVMDTIYGVSRLYFDLVSLGESVLEKQEALRTAIKTREDDEQQEKLGTMAPVDLAQAEALESSSRFDLIQTQGLYKQEEIILRDQLLRTASPVFTAQFSEIVPTDKIVVPDQVAPLDVPALVAQALARRPDLAQAELQVKAGKINANASRNDALPQLNVYGNVETRGTSEQPYETLGTTGNGIATTPQDLSVGGLRVSTIYQAGVQLTLPLRNRIAASDAARDQIEVRREQSRTEKLAQQIREQVATAVVSLQTAQAAYDAAVASRKYQLLLLDAQKDKLSVGQATDLEVLQAESYLAQAEATEIAARSDWMKARIELDHDLGDLLDKNHVELDDAIRGTMPDAP